ncbi:MAG: aminotransferase class III-fold pyridoxal phosphate-dependent enzyme [Rhodospirillaceae bacterium]|nr:aminotransferase class III-fold pyridoxal phosphate-dependent enzyme [Rhodospirillaceae bacterium]
MTHTAEFSPTGLIRGALSSRSDQALSALESRTAHSWMMALDRAKVLPETAAAAPNAAAVRLFVKASAGARITDVDGTSFIDVGLGDGALVLGHAHPAVQQAIVAQSMRGWHFDLPADGQLELARLIQTAGAANERVALCNSSDDAVAYAIGAARAFTGKCLIATFTGLHGNSIPGADDTTATAHLTVLPYGHPAALDQIRRRHHELAAVIVEPVRGGDPNLDRAAWLHSLIATCREAGVAVILDERQTGFRLAYGGAQELLGLLPDLVIYGKTVGGGLPLGAVAGRADVMASTQDHKKTESPPPALANPLSVTAGTAALGHLHARRATLYPALNEAGRTLAEQFNAFAQAHHMPVEMRCAGSIFRIVFASTVKAPEWAATFRAAEAAFNVLVLNRGVLMLTSQRGFLSTAHTGADLDNVLKALTESLRDVRDDGLFTQRGA